MLKEPDSTRPGDVVIWLQKAFALADQLEDAVAPGLAELKVSGSVVFLTSTVNHGTIRYQYYEHSVFGHEPNMISRVSSLTIVFSPSVFQCWII